MRPMEMVEMVFRGNLGLEQWVQELAASVEGVLLSHGVEWKRNFPVTLREALRLGLQQHVVGTHACAPHDSDGCYRVWLALPEEGVGAWAHELAGHIQSGCGLTALRRAPLNLDLEGLLRQHLEPHLQRASSALLFAGQVYR